MAALVQQLTAQCHPEAAKRAEGPHPLDVGHAVDLCVIHRPFGGTSPSARTRDDMTRAGERSNEIGRFEAIVGPTEKATGIQSWN